MEYIMKRNNKPGVGGSCLYPSYLGGWDQEDHGSRAAQANSLQDTIFKITGAKWAGDTVHAVNPLLCKHKAWVQNSTPTKKERKKENLSQQPLSTDHPEYYGHGDLSHQCTSRSRSTALASPAFFHISVYPRHCGEGAPVQRPAHAWSSAAQKPTDRHHLPP
jgi:hypothetical protein